MPVVIVENDTSQWADQTGAVYHFPKRYEKWLAQGTEVIYYKGRLKDKAFASARLSNAPHYFAIARIGKVDSDKSSKKGDLFAAIESYTPFESPIPAKIDGEYLETIPATRVKNYWRDGVRHISQADYDAILSHLELTLTPVFDVAEADIDHGPQTFESANEGSKSSYFGTKYERRRELRSMAIKLHGVECKVCGFNFERAYGEHAKGFIHVHHVVPLSTFDGEKAVNPKTDLVPLCANCHAVVHLKRDMTLTIDELKEMLRGYWVTAE